jgi:predicted permease
MSLAKAPAFSAMAVLTIALGIASTTALFSVVYAVLLQPLAFPDPGRVVALNTVFTAEGKSIPAMTGGDFMDLRAASHSFSGMATYSGGEIGVRVDGHTAFASTFFVDPGYFPVFGVKPMLGRLPDSPADAGRTAVLTSSFAQSSFGRIGDALGQRVVVDNREYAVSAVLDDKLAFPEKAQVWIMASADPSNQNRTSYNYRAVARMRPGVSLSRAQAELSLLGTRSAGAHPESNQGKSFRAVSLQDQLTAPFRKTLLLLFGAALVLLLISSANVANLMLARAASRMNEMAVRVSLGCSPRGLVRLLLAEGALLGVAASIAGILLSFIALRLIFPVLPASVPRAAESLHVHVPVLLFAVGACAATIVLCSLLPALRLRHVEVAEVLKRAPSRGSVGGDRSRNLVVITQIALCCILCVGAALLSRSMLALLRTPIGIQPQRLLVMYADEPAYKMPQYLRAIRTFETLLDRIRALPGVRSAAAIMGLPTGQYGSNGSYMVEGVHIQARQDPFKMNWPRTLPWAVFALASPDYFSTVGIRLLAGRDFNSHDQYEAPFTAIVSESLARQSFGTSNPMGRRIYCGLDSPKPMTIVGVVSDVRQDSPASAPEPEIYMPFQQHPFHANELQLVIRSERSPEQLIPEVRTTVQRSAPSMAARFTSFSRMLDDSISAPRFRAALCMSFASVAIGLAITGVYAVMMCAVHERRAEMGVRMALGAAPGTILRLISLRALALGLAGVCVGLPIAAFFSRFVASLLYAVHPLDIWAFLLGGIAVIAVVLAASVVPALRAARIDPAVVLRGE